VTGLPFSSSDLMALLPVWILSIAAMVIMLVNVTRQKPSSSVSALLSLIGIVGAAWAAWSLRDESVALFHDMYRLDAFSTFFTFLFLAIAAVGTLFAWDYLKRTNLNQGEYYALILLSTLGMMFMAAANDLIMIFIGLEISSIATYILAGYLRDDPRGNEAALKYFLLGSFATAFLLYGIAWIYGLTGTTNLVAIRSVISSRALAPSPILVGLSAALMFVGLGFKVSGAPFQIWAPDVYQGAPAPVTAFMSAGPKAAAFAVFLRIFMTAFEPIGAGWEPLVWLSALLSMTIGNFAALTQSNIKRLLAYSSIAHAGYVLVAIAARSDTGAAAAMFYLAAYALMNVGAFAVVSHLAGKGERFVSVDDFAGLASRQPFTAALLTVFLLSLIGVPLTGGFFGKFYIFKAALQSRLVWLTILGLLNSAVAAYYYLRILVVMYMREPADSAVQTEPLGIGMRTALVLTALGTFLLGIFPAAVLNFAGKSAVLVR